MKNRKFLTSVFALMMVLSALVFVGCGDSIYTFSLHIPSIDGVEEGENYTVNGTKVSDAYWSTFILANKGITLYKYGSRESWGNEDLIFKVENNKLIYSYISTFGSYSGEVVGVDNTIDDGKKGFVFILKTEDHKNYTQGTCSGAPEDFDDTQPHSCYLPIYFAFVGDSMLNGAYAEMEGGNCKVACFYDKTDAIAHGKYSSEIYGGAATYSKVN